MTNPDLPDPEAPMNLDTIVEMLDRHRQRSTYGAVAALLGLAPRSLMTGRPKNPKNSWVVAKETGLPTGYGHAERHADLLAP